MITLIVLQNRRLSVKSLKTLYFYLIYDILSHDMCFRFMIHLSCYTSIFAVLTDFGIIFDLENRRQAHLDLYRVIDCEIGTIVI